MAAAGTQDRLIRALNQFGFTTSDAKAYMALLKSHPATGYELTASSGIPRSAIYNVLRRLEALNVVNRVKVHTAFHGRVESGVCKMVVCGLGKKKGVETFHRRGADRIFLECFR